MEPLEQHIKKIQDRIEQDTTLTLRAESMMTALLNELKKSVANEESDVVVWRWQSGADSPIHINGTSALVGLARDVYKKKLGTSDEAAKRAIDEEKLPAMIIECIKNHFLHLRFDGAYQLVRPDAL